MSEIVTLLGRGHLKVGPISSALMPAQLPAPAAIVQALANLHVLGQLLHVADPLLWESHARPSAAELAAAIFAAHQILVDELGEIFDFPSGDRDRPT